MRKWQADNPGAAIYVLQAQDLPPIGTAYVQTADEFLAMDDALNDLTPNVEVSGLAPLAAEGQLDCRVGQHFGKDEGTL